jgi:hypothetical protein
MPPKPTNRTPEPATAIRVELGAFGLWLEVQRATGDWEGVFLPTCTVRRLVAALLADRQQILAALDPPCPRRGRASQQAQRAGSGSSRKPGVGRGSHLGSDHAPSLRRHKE